MLTVQAETIAAAIIGVFSTIGAIKGHRYFTNGNGKGKGCPDESEKHDLWTKEMHDEICTLKLTPIHKGIKRIETTLQRMEAREMSRHE